MKRKDEAGLKKGYGGSVRLLLLSNEGQRQGADFRNLVWLEKCLRPGGKGVELKLWCRRWC